MASLTVVEAVSAKLAAEWSAVPVLPDNAGSSTPADGSAFIVVQFPWARSEQISFGSPGANLYREEGAFRLVLNVERGSGADQGRQWADDLAAIFRGKDLGSGVRTYAPTPAATDDDNENGNYFTLAVAVPYDFDFLA